MEILDLINENPELMAVIDSIKIYLPTLNRENNKQLYDQFVENAYQCNWIELDKLMFPFMTEEEKSNLSVSVLENARKTVERIIVAEKITKAIFLKIIEIAIQRI